MKRFYICITPNESILYEFHQKYTIHPTPEWINRCELSRDTYMYFFSDLASLKIFFDSGYIDEIGKIIYINIAKNLIDSEIGEQDIVVPHTYIWDNQNSLFLENTLGTEYDFEKFKLHLSGICVSNPNVEQDEDDFIGDIEDKNVYSTFSYLDNLWLKDLCIWIFWVSQKQENIKILLSIVDFIIQD